MDRDIIVSVMIVIVLIALSAFFSASETAFTSANRIRLSNEAQKGDRRAGMAQRLQEDYGSVLSTILVGNNIVNIASTSIATVMFVSLSPTYGATIATVVMTIVVLIFGEITPKAIAKQQPEKFAKSSAPVVNLLIRILKPINWLFDTWNKFVASRFKVEAVRGISEEELLAIVAEAEYEGGLEDHEHRLIRSAIEFNNWEATRILVPRVDVVGIDIDSTDEEIQQVFDSHSYSRLLVYDDSIDNVKGVLLEKDFVKYLRQKAVKTAEKITIANYLKETLFVPPVMKLPNLLQAMQQNMIQMTVVTDEYGGILGIVTMEDIIEDLIGEVWDESDVVSEEIIPLEQGGNKILGNASLAKIFPLLQLYGWQNYHSKTISGFVTEELGRFAQEGDWFDYQGTRFLIRQVSGSRVIEVETKKLTAQD